MEKNNSALFYTCSLVEYIARKTKNMRMDVLKTLGEANISRIYKYADVFHSEPIEKVADDFIEKANISEGTYDNISSCKYAVPDYWDIGEVFERLIEDCFDGSDIVGAILEVYNSWIADQLLNFNSDLFYQNREYLAMCYKEGKVLM